MTKPACITAVDPTAAIPGGEVVLTYEAAPGTARELEFAFEEERAHVTAAGTSRALVLMPDVQGRESVGVSTITPQGSVASDQRIVVGTTLATGLHPVANPAFSPDDGSLFVTRSGSRGERVPTSLFRITSGGTVEEYSGDIMNPTGIAFDRSGRMFVTSRFDGTVYRITAEREALVFASDLGIATGLAFNRQGDMFVGDRSGTIHRVNEIGESRPWAQHEPSVSAYHLAFGPDEALYVTGPTVSSFDAVTRFDDEGNASTFYRGLGRPQGLAFDVDGNLYVAASLRGRRGIVRISPDARAAELMIAGMNLVGLAFGQGVEIVIATNDTVYRLPIIISGPKVF